MGFSGVGPVELLLVLGIVIMVFGTKKLRNLGSDLGGALRGFRNAMHDGENDVQQRDGALNGAAEHEDAGVDADKVKQ